VTLWVYGFFPIADHTDNGLGNKEPDVVQ